MMMIIARTSLLAKTNLFAHIRHGHFLRSGDDDGSVHTGGLEVLHDGDVLVRGARRGVDDEVIQRSPIHVREELLDQTVLPGSPPDDRVVHIGEHEADGHDPQVVVHVHRGPATSTLMHLLSHQAQLQPTHIHTHRYGIY